MLYILLFKPDIEKISKIQKQRFKFFFIITFLLSYINIFIDNERILYSHTIRYKGQLILKQKLINDYLSRISEEYKTAKYEEKVRFDKYFNLAIYTNNSNIMIELKDKFLKMVSLTKNQTITHIDTFYFLNNMNFGNSLIQVNNAIFYCEIVGCQKIILNNNSLGRKWLIVNDLYIEKLNISILHDKNIDCKKENILCFYKNSFPFYPKVVIPQVRTDLIKEELLRNLPNVSIDSEALYIHIRGGDIFRNFPLLYYSQPPLCFYEKLINSTIFKKYIFVKSCFSYSSFSFIICNFSYKNK